MPELVDDLSSRLRTAEEQGRPIPPLNEIAAGDLDVAYAVQSATVAVWKAAGRFVVGHKIGLTHPRVQKQLGVDQPDFGVLVDDMSYADGATIPAGGVLQPRIEAELAFVIGRDLPGPSITEADIIAATAEVRPSLEIVGSRIADWKVSIVDTIADNASCGAFVLADVGCPVDAVDMRGATMVLERTRDGVTEVVSSGATAECLGSPINAARWLAEELVRRGDPLRAGEVILTGALGPMVDVVGGDAYVATIEGVGTVSVSFA